MNYKFLKYTITFQFCFLSLSAWAQVDSLYALAIKKGDASYEFKWLQNVDERDPKNKARFEASRILYANAIVIKPGQSYPIARIKEIDQVLNYFKSLPLIFSADSLLRLNIYKPAYACYKKADSLYSTTYTKEKTVLSLDAIAIANIDSTRKYILEVIRIDSICKGIDDNKSLSEGIREGAFPDKKGGWETYDLKNRTFDTLYRIRHYRNTDSSYKTTFYYHENKVIKAIITVEKWNYGKPVKTICSTTYYFDDHTCIKSFAENLKYSNQTDILKQGLYRQEQFYRD